MARRGRVALRCGAVAVGALLGILAATAVDAERPAAGPAAAEPVRAWPASPFEGSPLPDDVRVPDVALRDERGDTVRLAHLDGPAVVTFGSAVCEETCPLQAHIVRGALDDVGRDVAAFIVGVDPARDTPEAARHFLVGQRLAGRIRFLVGPPAALRATWRGFAVAPQSAREHHQARIVLIDGRGRQRVGSFSAQATAETVAHDLRLLLDEPVRERTAVGAAAAGSAPQG